MRRPPVPKRAQKRFNTAKVCPHCSKLCYRTEDEAEDQIRRVPRLAGCRSYRCTSGFWHTTSKPSRA